MMKKYSANYSYTNHNFVIQNLTNTRKESDYLPAILIIKNLLQRGRPTLMSQYLQSIYGSIHKEIESFKKPFVLINQSDLLWNDTIKGDSKNNYFPAKTFLNERISEDLSEFEFIKKLIIPEIEINKITHRNDKNFKHQCVDFFLPQANLVIEIDGQQHKEEVGRVVDSIRDNHLKLSKILTVRIDTKDLEEKNAIYFEKIEQIKNQLKKYSRFLNLYKTNYNLSFSDISEDIKRTKLLPTAIIRFQVLVLELLENGILKLDDGKWNFEIKNKDVKGYENHAIEDIFEWLHHILKLQKILFKEPQFEIKNVQNFSNNNNNNNNSVKIDFSLLERWTDQNTLSEDIIYVRTDYLDLFHNRNKEKLDQVNYFKLSTFKKFKYNLVFNEESDDIENLVFFLKNIFEYNKFNNGQISIIQNVLENNTTIGLLPTGGGKSLTYQFACLLQPCISFVVCPIKSLMHDQVKDLDQAYIQNIAAINSDVVGAERTEILDNFSNGKYFFVFISPERFQTKDFRERLIAINSQLNFSYAVIDEVHCLSEWGHDFRTSYLNLSKTIKKYCPTINFLGLTATASVNVLKDIQLEFNIDQKNVKTLTDYTRPELEFIVINDGGNKYQEITTIVENHNQVNNIFESTSENQKCGLIFTPFVNGVNGCFNLSNRLTNEFNSTVKFYSGSKPSNYKNDLDFEKYKIKVQDEYKQNKFNLLTATKAFGMGINKKNICFTVHYGMPASMESLYQEAGRAGRDKSEAKCYVLLTEENPETDVQTIFNPQSTYEEIQNLREQVGRNGQDVFRQIFLYQNGLDSISKELELVSKLHTTYSETGASKVIYAGALGSNKAKVEKAIYRLSNIGVISDWTVDDFFNGVFTVTYNAFTEKSIKSTLLKFIKKYVDDFEFDNHSERIKYTNILNDTKLPKFERLVKILLQWSYDKFGTNRRESLKNVYENCLKYDDTIEGKESFKKTLEAYFKFTEATYILQHIAENNNKDISKWFEVFYDEKDNFIKQDSLIDLKGNLQRFLESFQSNTGLNLINGLTKLLLNESFNNISEQRFVKSFDTISKYEVSKFDYIIDHILEISKRINQKRKIILLKFLYKFSKTEEEKIRFAKELGDTETLLVHYNKRIKSINKNIEYGFRKIG